jgi:hypothetical protein
MGRCFVIQPFDQGGPYDRRYDEVLAPAIGGAGLEPYRVDRDPGADVPIETIESEIRSASVCIADISDDNPNVWYELGFAGAAGKDVVLLSSATREKYPFDIQHLNVIRYDLTSPSDFETLSSRIEARLDAIVKRPTRIQELTAVTRQDETEGLKEHEIAALVTIMGECIGPGEMLSTYQLRSQMEQAGYTPAATGMAVRKLASQGLVEVHKDRDFDGDEFTGCAITDQGAAWLSEHEEKVELRVQQTQHAPFNDDDIPF